MKWMYHKSSEKKDKKKNPCNFFNEACDSKVHLVKSVVDMCCRNNEQSCEVEFHRKNYYDNLKIIQ